MALAGHILRQRAGALQDASRSSRVIGQRASVLDRGALHRFGFCISALLCEPQHVLKRSDITFATPTAMRNRCASQRRGPERGCEPAPG